jgi:hypothetical protein
MNKVLNNGEANASARDPIEWAIIAVVISGSSLILALETKIKARQRAESEEAARKALARNRLRLNTISDHLNEMRRFVSEIPELGKIEINTENVGITRGSIIFASDADEERFNQKFDRMTTLIGRINRCLSEIDSQGFHLNDDDVQKYVTDPMRRAQNKVIPLLQADIDPYTRIQRANELLAAYADMVVNLERVLASQ